MSKYSPYIPDLEAWKNHFTKSTTRHKSFHPLESIKTQLREKTDAIKLVVPTEQQVQQAEAELKRSRSTLRWMVGAKKQSKKGKCAKASTRKKNAQKKKPARPRVKKASR